MYFISILSFVLSDCIFSHLIGFHFLQDVVCKTAIDYNVSCLCSIKNILSMSKLFLFDRPKQLCCVADSTRSCIFAPRLASSTVVLCHSGFTSRRMLRIFWFMAMIASFRNFFISFPFGSSSGTPAPYSVKLSMRSRTCVSLRLFHCKL